MPLEKHPTHRQESRDSEKPPGTEKRRVRQRETGAGEWGQSSRAGFIFVMFMVS